MASSVGGRLIFEPDSVILAATLFVNNFVKIFTVADFKSAPEYDKSLVF